MLYLRDSLPGGEVLPVAIAEQTVQALELALLAPDRVTQSQLVVLAIENDHAFATWAHRHSRQNSVAESATWLCEGLVSKLVTSLFGDYGTNFIELAANSDNHAQSSLAEQRLLALVTKLNDFEKQAGEFESRLEREKLESLKELAYGAGHEVNNPLANIAARAQALLADEPHPERQRKLTAIHRQAMRAHEMIADLMLFARPPKLTVSELNLGELVQQVVDEFKELAVERSIALSCAIENPPINIHGDETQIGVAVGAVINNAIEAVGASGHVEVAARKTVVDRQPWVEVVVRDDGSGISAEVGRHLFDPFFSGREAGRGLGFGLSKCWRIVTEHGGQVVVNSVAGHGAEFIISLPAG